MSHHHFSHRLGAPQCSNRWCFIPAAFTSSVPSSPSLRSGGGFLKRKMTTELCDLYTEHKKSMYIWIYEYTHIIWINTYHMYIHTSYYVYIVLHCINTYNDAHISIHVYIHSITFYTSTCGWWSRLCDSFWRVFTQRKPFKSPWMLNTSPLEHQWAHIAIFCIKTSASLTDHFDPYPLNFCWTEIHRLIIIFAIWWPCVGQSLLSFHSESSQRWPMMITMSNTTPQVINQHGFGVWTLLGVFPVYHRIPNFQTDHVTSHETPKNLAGESHEKATVDPHEIWKSAGASSFAVSPQRNRRGAPGRPKAICVQASTDQGKMCLSTSPISRGTILSQDLK